MKALPRAELKGFLVERQAEDHKGTFGHVLVVAGSRGMLGAAVLATKGALRSGAGLVTLALPVSLQGYASSAVPEALTLGLPEAPGGWLRPEAVARLKTAAKDHRYTTLALGPGLSQHIEAAKAVVGTLSSLALPAVVDADALNALAGLEPEAVRELLRQRKAPCVFTPHPGEMARCLGTTRQSVGADRAGAAERLARDWGGVALLKGHKTVISSGARTVVNVTGGSGLAKGGTGDVLCGLIAGLWAQMIASGRFSGDAPFAAAALGAHLHGLAGEAAEHKKTAYATTAGDVADALPKAFAALLA